MTVTLADVAAAAGVSRSTASRALSGSTLISADTRRTVEEAARTLGYRPNRAASALRSNKSHLVGLVMNNLLNATFHTVAEVVHKRCSDNGFQVLLCITDADPSRERDVLAMLGDHGVDGTIVIGSGRSAVESNALLSQGRAVVNVIRSVRGAPHPPSSPTTWTVRAMRRRISSTSVTDASATSAVSKTPPPAGSGSRATARHWRTTASRSTRR